MGTVRRYLRRPNATRWLRLKGWPRTCEQSLHLMYRSSSMNAGCLRPPHHIQRNGLVRLADKASNLEIATASVERVPDRGRGLGRPLVAQHASVPCRKKKSPARGAAGFFKPAAGDAGTTLCLFQFRDQFGERCFVPEVAKRNPARKRTRAQTMVDRQADQQFRRAI
jgi:hypothetical protein